MLLIEIIHDNFSLYKSYIVYHEMKFCCTSRQFLLGIKQEAERGLYVGWIPLEEKSFLSTRNKKTSVRSLKKGGLELDLNSAWDL